MRTSVLEQPQQRVGAKWGRGVYQSQMLFPDGRVWLVRVVVDEKEGRLSAVTVYRTSKVEKYWRPQ